MSLYNNNETLGSDARVIEINKPVLGQESLFASNVFSTGKYSIFSFFPKNIFEQFHRIANVWFLIVSIFQVLPLNLSPTSSWATIAPLCLVLTVTMIKDGYQDYQRHSMDKLVNHKLCQVWSFSLEKFHQTLWQDLTVGNIILIENEEQLPADIILFNSSSSDKTCYIETSNLDGESNLKLKNCVLEVANSMDSVSPETGLKTATHLESSTLKTEHPNNRLHTFEGTLKLRGHPRGIPLDIKNMLLRGSTLKNTKWAVGIVVFTGPDSKLARNSKTPSHKRSRVELKVNKYLIVVFSVLFTIVTLSSSISIAVSYKESTQVNYFSGSTSVTSPLVFITFMILYNSFVPISLYVTMDIVRVVQAKFIQWDRKMYLASSDCPTQAKNGDLNEELGQIEYLFTDKTGTLTENSMFFKKCAIRGKVYESSENEHTNSKCKLTNSVFQDDLCGPNAKFIEEFLETLALCNTVIVDSKTQPKVYQAASPDEEALVTAADFLGFSLVSTRPNMYILQITSPDKQRTRPSDECLEYKVLGINEFNSDRKRMSIVLEPMSDKYRPAMMLCKGADSSVFPLCEIDSETQSLAEEQLTSFASEGLRTLVICKKNLTHTQATDYEHRYILARNSLYDREKRLEELAEEFEVGLELIGITGIEDKVQDRVAETVTGLQEAGVKVWMLTGDKQETAVNIGFSTKLLSTDMAIVKLNCKSVEEARKALKTELYKHIDSKKQRQNSVLSKVKAVSESISQSFIKNDPSRSFITTKYQIVKETLEAFEGDIKIKDIQGINQSLVVDGITLTFILSDLQTTKYFILLSSLCKSVICCRTSPLQKSEIVKLVKSHLVFKPITLAVGDGANDVSMIREAHVGVGIIGKEGMQAANSSDYAIARFSYLLRLLQIHGRWNYSRISRVILYSFYKNFILVLPLFYYSFINLYSGTSYYDSWLMLGYNVVFTALPVFIMGTLDQDLSADQLLKHTELYSVGIFSKLFNAKIFLKWSLKAIIHSLLIFFLWPDRVNFTLTKDGSTECSDACGTASFFVVVQTATYEILLETEHWNVIFLVVTILSVLIFYPFVFMYDKSGFPTGNLEGVAGFMFGSQYFLYILLVPCVCLLVSLSLKYFESFWSKDNVVDLIKRRTNKVMAASRYLSTVRIKRKTETNRIFRYRDAINRIFVAKGLSLCGNEDEDRDYYSTYKYFLYFKNAFLEKIFENYSFERNQKYFQRLIGFIFFVFIVWSVLDFLYSASPELITLRSITFCLIFTTSVLSFTKHFHKYHQPSIILSLILFFTVKFLQEYLASYDGSLSTSLVLLFTSIFLRISSYKIMTINILFFVVSISLQFSIIFQSYSQLSAYILALNYLILVTGVLVVCSFTCYVMEKVIRKEFSLKKQLEFKLEKAQAILGYLLPDFVKDRVKQGVTYIEEKENVTVVFCDIYNFDMICATHESDELLELLDKFFAVLDQLCEKNGVTKIETVNKTYMICGGLLSDKEESLLPAEIKMMNHAERCVELSLQILKHIEPVYLKTQNKLQVKIGINSGNVIAGVVGEHKPQFSLVGNSVNTAARMCQTLQFPDKIQISSSTFNMIRNEKYCFTSNTVAPKGLDLQETFILDLAKFRRSRKRDVRVGEDDKLIELTSNHIHEEFSELRPSHTILLPELDRFHVSRLTYNCDLDQIAVFESEGLELVGSIQWLQCTLKETRLQNKFRISMVKDSLFYMTWGTGMSLAVYSLEWLMFVIGFVYLDGYGNSSLVALKALCVLAMGLVMLSMKRNYRQAEFPWVVTMVYICTSFISTVTLISVPVQFRYIQVLKILFTNLVVTHQWNLPFSFVLLATCASYTTWICAAFKSSSWDFALESSAYVSVFFILNLLSKASFEMQFRKSYNLNKFAQKEIKNTEKLLNQMMPPQVLRNLHNDITTTDKYKDVTIIYADISGFTSFCKTKEPIEVVGMLSKLFSVFDHLCVRHNVYKVHTIGDCYVILSFTDGDVRDPANECVNCVEMALDMVKAIKKVNRSKGIALNMRIGMHTGTVIAGITGTNIVRYDIYGPDNDIANKMESSGCPGKINVSKVTKEMLESQCPGRFLYEFNKVVTYVPTGVELDAYFVVPVLESDVMLPQE